MGAVRGRVRRRFEGTGGLAWAALAAAFVGTVFLIAVLASPGSWEWTGSKQVAGTEQNGVVYYTYSGHHYSTDDVNSFRTGPRTVWVDPSNPSNAVLHVTVAQASDWAVTAGPYTACVVLLIAGFWRRRRILRERRERAANPFIAFGDGIDDDTIRSLLAKRDAGGGSG
jgi:hypothetical protein